MQLISDIKINPSYIDNIQVQINTGIEILESGKYLEDSRRHGHRKYWSGIYRPKNDWRELNEEELKQLLNNEDVSLSTTIHKIRIPDEVYSQFYSLSLNHLLNRKETKDASMENTFPIFLSSVREFLEEEIFEPFELCGAHVNITPPGYDSTTYDGFQKRYRGLHIDNWGSPRRSPDERYMSGVRVGINMGRDTRNFVFCNLSLALMLKMLRTKMDEKQFLMFQKDTYASPIIESFLEKFPDYPIIKMSIKPKEGYVAPVQNIVHDGYCNETEQIDYNLQLSSNHFRLKESFLNHINCSKVEKKSIFDTFGSLKLLILQATPFCNLDCQYCYLPDRIDRSTMSIETFEKIVERVFETHLAEQSFTICWHAGEPLAVPRGFYADAAERVKKMCPDNCQISYSFQTNGVFLDQEWCDLIKKYGFKIGISVDGPKFLHDINRTTRTGHGTHKQVVRAIELLQKNEIDFHTISVITNETLNYPDEFISFFVDHGITSIGVNIEEIEGVNVSSSLQTSDVDLRFREFTKRIYEIVKIHPEIRFREFDNAERFILSSPYVRNTLTSPFQNITVDYRGNFSTFSPELLGIKSQDYGDFIIGNVMTTSFREASESEKFKRLYSEISSGVSMCKNNCDYFRLCGGGCPSNKYFENGTFISTETLDCRLKKKVLYDVVLNSLEERFSKVC